MSVKSYQKKYEIEKYLFDYTEESSLSSAFPLILSDDYKDVIDQKKWKKSKFELKKVWRRLAKNDVLTSMLADKELDEATETIEKRYKNRLRRISQRNEEDIFSISMNNLTSYFDPHSSYFSPKSAEDFAISGNTISYELLAGIGPRIKRLLHH